MSEKKGITKEQLQALLDHPLVKKLGPECREAILAASESLINDAEKSGSLVVTSKQTVNYDRNIADSLEAGKYDWVNEDLTDHNFPSDENGEKEVEFGLFRFDITVTSDGAIVMMKVEDYRPATMKELLAYGEKNREVQRQFPVVALGSVASLSDGRCVGYLRSRGTDRSVYLNYYGCDWHSNYRFLGVRLPAPEDK